MTESTITPTNQAIMTTDLPLAGRRQGKVRDIYEAHTTAGEPVLLIIASDRISAFDVVMPNGIPGKGVLLTQISKFWLDFFTDDCVHPVSYTHLTLPTILLV